MRWDVEAVQDILEFPGIATSIAVLAHRIAHNDHHLCVASGALECGSTKKSQSNSSLTT